MLPLFLINNLSKYQNSDNYVYLNIDNTIKFNALILK